MTWHGAAVAACLMATIAFPQNVSAAVWFSIQQLLTVTPAMLIGVGLTALVTASGSMALVAAAFHGRELRMIVLAAFLGALTPVCGVSVLPLIGGLLVSRVPLAPVMAFWLSSPITGPGMLAITAATLGVPFAVGKSLAAFFIGIYAGLATFALTRAGCLSAPARSAVSRELRHQGGCSSETIAGVDWCVWRSPERRRLFFDVAVATTRLMLIWLSLAFVCEYYLNLFLPQAFIAELLGEGRAWAVPLAATVGAPLYLDGYAALPLVRGFIDAGMRPDAAMALLISGGITSAWAIVPVLALVRLPVVACYLLLAVSSAILAGWTYGLFLR